MTTTTARAARRTGRRIRVGRNGTTAAAATGAASRTRSLGTRSPWYTVTASGYAQIAPTVPSATAPSDASAARPSRGAGARRCASAIVTATTTAPPRATVAANKETPVTENGDRKIAYLVGAARKVMSPPGPGPDEYHT